jgi:branched-chain amino acid transport system permease protein
MNNSNITSKGWALLFVFALAVAALLPHAVGEYWVRLMNSALVASAAVLGLNFVLGYTGQISMMHAAVCAIAAYTVAVGTVKFGLNPWLACLIGITAAGAFSYLIGVILLRLKGHYFALATLGVNVSLIIVVSNWVEVTGGSNGISGVPALTILGTAIDSERSFFYFGLVLVALLTAFAYYIRRSELGHAMIAARDDELAASVSGLSLMQVKVTALTLGGVYGGVAGVMFALHARFVAPEDFGVHQSIVYLAMLVVGGEATIVGSLLGAVVITFMPEWLRWVGSAYLVIFGLIVLLMLFLAPKGLAGLLGKAWDRWNSHTLKGAKKWRFSKSGQ